AATSLIRSANFRSRRAARVPIREISVCCCFVRGRAGACFGAKQGARSEVWSFQMSDEERSVAQKQARPLGLRGSRRNDNRPYDAARNARHPRERPECHQRNASAGSINTST